ncbi:MAG: ABC transporter substrate-binding protein [Acidimicrobiaceae bacterium]|nr:ABC transporter substrate-binding protein [Acidimicrobiaceae bacterium]
MITAALVVSACTSDDDGADDEEVATSDAGDDTTDTTEGGDDTTETTEGGDDTTDTTEGGDDTTETTEGGDETTDTTEAEGDDGDTGMDDSMVGVEGGSGCGIPHGPYEEAEASGEVRVAWNDPLLSFNQNTTHANATANANVAYLMHSGFNYYDGDLNLVNNDQFGTCTIESLDPLTVTYRINEGVSFSDGTPITAHDLILGWGATSGNFNEGGVAFLEDGSAIQTDEEGNWLVLTPEGDIVPEEAGVHYDPETFELFEGFEYVPAESVNFDAASEQFELVTQFPEVSEDGQAITMVYDSFYVDYQNGTPFLGNPAAHVVGRLALGIEDPTEAKQAVVDAFQNNDSEALAQIATVFNTAFDHDSLPDDEGIYLSTGMYELTAYEERAEMTLVANPDYTWGPQPKVETIIYRIIGDPTAAVQALANEEIDIMQPQATVDSVAELEGYADRGIELVTGDTAVYEHVDFAVANGGPFDPATYGGDEATALAVRQAFMKVLPRQEIIERLIAPINPEAEVRDSFTQTPGAPWYDGIVAGNGTADYAEVDIEGAVALLEEAGVETPVNVRFHFADNNPRRGSQYELIAASAAEAGFNVIDGRSPTWGSELSNPSIYDAAMFGWQSTAVAVADTGPNFITGGANNFYGYSNEEIDALYEELNGTTDPARQEEILTEVEATLVETGFGLPIFQHPGVTAFNSNYVSNVNPIAISPTIFWNVWDWEAA